MEEMLLFHDRKSHQISKWPVVAAVIVIASGAKILSLIPESAKPDGVDIDTTISRKWSSCNVLPLKTK